MNSYLPFNLKLIMKETDIFFVDKHKLRVIDQRRIAYILLAIAFFFITETLRGIYRPYIYTNDINDFGFADTIGNLGGIIVQIFFSLAIVNAEIKKSFIIITLLIIAYIVYEIMQPILPKGVYDIKDIYATLIGGAIAILIFLYLQFNKKYNKVIFTF